jgi:hypothetical protein
MFSKESVMIEAKTHFAQVPLAVVKEILEKQVVLEDVIEPGQVKKKKASHERPLNAEGTQSGGKR